MSDESADGASLVARCRINRAKPFGHRRPGSRRDVTPSQAAPSGEAGSTDGVTFAASPGTPHRSHSISPALLMLNLSPANRTGLAPGFP